MAVLGLISIPISFINLQHKLNILSYLDGSVYGWNPSPNDLEMLIATQLGAYGNGIEIAQIFWGLWLLPFGYLVFKSGFLPKVLGVLLMLGCFGYLIEFFGGLLFPNYGGVFQTIVGLPASIGEIGTCLWMLLLGDRKGFKRPQ